jgi:hypothetical protein
LTDTPQGALPPEQLAQFIWLICHLEMIREVATKMSE